jgi:hypothetical protein
MEFENAEDDIFYFSAKKSNLQSQSNRVTSKIHYLVMISSIHSKTPSITHSTGRELFI